MGQVFVTVDEISKDAKFIDTRFSLTDEKEGERLYNEGHIEGAIYWHLSEDLSNMNSAEGRHPMPTKESLQTLFENSGLRYEDEIVIYDQGGMPYAARAYFMLKYGGFPHVYIVNGGYDALKEHFAITHEKPAIDQTMVALNWQDELYATRDDVKKIVDGEDHATLLDARANGRYVGDYEPLDAVAGHIPTAKNFDWEQLKKENSLIVTDALREKVAKEDNIVVYCGSGVTASPLFAVLTEAGYENVRLYVGSFSDWIRQYDVEKGENK